MADNARCPKCNTYNALLAFQSPPTWVLMLKCRDCGHIVPVKEAK